jgi:hypothetical protein
MSQSTLTFVSTESLRNGLLVRNLQPYSVPGVYTPPVSQIAYEITQSNYSVVNSPDELVASNPFANQLYPLNQFGPDGGFNLDITFNGPLLPLDPNQGPYYPVINSPLVLSSGFYLNQSNSSPNIQNTFRPVDGYIDLYSTEDIQNSYKIFAPYWDPPNFIPSFYSPYEIFLSNNPTGSDGTLSQDSFIAKLGAEQLKFLFQERVNLEIYQNTIGLVNLDSLQDPFEASLLVTGQQPLIFRNWKITVPENPILRAVDLATRLAGAYWPVSPIPGDYFDENEINGAPSQQTSNALNVVNQLTGGFLGPILNITRNPSEIFLANTGNAQRSALFRNIDYNRYQPAYKQTLGGLLGIAQGLTQAISSLINPDNGTLQGGYYVGSRNAEPGQITSPPNQVPVDPFGRQVNAPVYGPSELGILYEGNSDNLNFGLGGKSYSDGGGTSGQFVWTSPKYKGGAGYKPTVGGGIGSKDNEFNLVSSDYTKNESTNINFKQSSILDSTQRLIDSADNVQGISRLKHVGNAINQVSKVFNDGYKEMTKGSKVVSYTDNTTGTEVGREYCRVFAKDIPYLTYGDLQKRDGITTSGRRFTNSVLDNTYNLNIAPLRGSTEDRIGSTNLQKNNTGKVVAKKYMFSIENLAWRTSSKPDFTYDDLPDCEKGPNGGRVMWFPPYDLKFSEQSSANWNPTSFLGRPEPIYTYKDTSRTGQLSWKIIVDHPSILNAIVEKQLKGQNKEKINSIIDSFFAGCVKYDIYELAKKFNTVPSKDLYTYQQIINNPRLTPEELEGVKREIPVDVTTEVESETPNTTTQEITPDTSIAEFESKYLDFAFYFDNDIPGPNSGTESNQEYETTYNTYISRKDEYINKANLTFSPNSNEINVGGFFDNVVIPNFKIFSEGSSNFITDAFNLLNNKKGTIVIEMVGSASATASDSYNESLSLRRTDAIIKYFKSKTIGDANLSKFIEDGSFKILPPVGAGENIVIPKAGYVEVASGTTTTTTTSTTTGFDVNCKEDIVDNNNKVTTNSQRFSVSAMACRRVRVSNISVTALPQPETKKEEEEIEKTEPIKTSTTITEYPPKPQPTIDIVKKLKDGIGKKILRQLLSECDYFEVIKEENPFVYDTIKEKIKYFSPSFHSMTPEGLNSRLVFLNQCMRPGETIPVIGPDNQPIYNDAVNTSFGAPPILVLRIGDFYNTKIVPTSLSIQYEPLIFDLNPEGIGVQPMIANVSLSFNFIGGSGLAGPIERLQNAISFNYFGNTEIYDERAVPTEDTSKIDKELEKSILDGETPTTVNNIPNQQQNDGGSTIGDIITNIPNGSGQTGEIDYQKVMDSLYDNTSEYFQTIVNQMEKINSIGNYGMVLLVGKSRTDESELLEIYDFNPNQVLIYGNPSDYESLIEGLFNICKGEVNDETNPIIEEFISEYEETYGEQTIDTLKNNLNNYITNLQSTFTTQFANSIQELQIYQQNFYQTMRKISLVCQSVDGKLLSGNIPRVYNLTGVTTPVNNPESLVTDTLYEIQNDFRKFSIVMDEYNFLLENYGIINSSEYGYSAGVFDTPFESELDDNEKSFYIIILRTLINKDSKETFISSITKGIENESKLVNRVERIVNKLTNKYEKELKKEEDIFTKLRKKKEYKEYVDGLDEKMYIKGKTRKVNYDTNTNSNTQSNGELIKQLYLEPFRFK